MNNSLFLNINSNNFEFLTLSNKNKVIENLAFILFNEKNKYKRDRYKKNILYVAATSYGIYSKLYGILGSTVIYGGKNGI